MDMKNTTILLIFLLCVLGLIIGVYYTESSESTKTIYNYDETVYIDSNGSIVIPSDLQQNESNLINRILENSF